MKTKNERSKAKGRGVVFLADLASRKDVKGGAGKLLFGEALEPPAAVENARAEGEKRPRRRREES